MNSSPDRQRVRTKYRTFDGYNYGYKTNTAEKIVESSNILFARKCTGRSGGGPALPNGPMLFLENLQNLMLMHSSFLTIRLNCTFLL